MKSTVEKVSNLQRKINIEIPANTVSSAYNDMLKGIQKQAAIKGFRQGKAPMATIKSIYGQKVKQDVINELIQKHYFEAVREHQLEPITYPEFEFDVLNEDQAFNFTASFEVKPDVNLKQYDGLEVQKEKFEVGDDKITQILENIRTSRAKLVDVTEDRPAQLGDTSVVDFEGSMNGAPLENGSGKDHNLELGAKQFIEGFEDGIVGMKIGDTKTLNLKFPDPYHSASLAGQPVDFKVTLKGLKKKELPELTDEFVADMMGQPGDTQTHTVESLKKTIRTDMEQSEKKRIDSDFKNRLLKALVRANPVEVPPSMLNEQKIALVNDMRKRMQEQGMGDEEFQAYVQKWDKDFEASAADMIQSGFLVDALARKLELSWTEEDLNKKFAEYAAQTGIDEARIREFYSRPEQTNRLTYSITEDKVVEYLTKSAKITEVAANQLKESMG
jgi:trigger factor